MIVSSQVDLICWTGRVGLICRDCREALTTGDAGGARRVSKRAAIEGPRGCRPFRDLRQLSGERIVNRRSNIAGRMTARCPIASVGSPRFTSRIVEATDMTGQMRRPVRDARKFRADAALKPRFTKRRLKDSFNMRRGVRRRGHILDHVTDAPPPLGRDSILSRTGAAIRV